MKYLLMMTVAMLAACSPTDKPAEQAAQSPASVASKNSVLIDVRTADEFNAGHLPNALHMPHDQIAQSIAATGVDKNAEIQLYCRSGSRAAQAQKTLQDLGFTNVKNLGAYQDLIKQK